jgi:hypothetical protein
VIEETAGKESIENAWRGSGKLVLDSGLTGTKDQIPVMESALGLFHGNCSVLTNLNAAFTTQTLFCVDGLRLLVFELENLDRTDFDTFTTSGTLVLIHSWREHKMRPPFFVFSIGYIV